MKIIQRTGAVVLLLAGFGLAQSTQKSDTLQLLGRDQIEKEIQGWLMSLVPVFSAPASAEEWTAQAGPMRQRMLEAVVFHGVPDEWRKQPTRVAWGDRIQADGYVIRKLRYEVVPGFWAGALLYEPMNLKGKVPAVLNPNGHEREGMFVPYKQARCINLAKRGMLALSTEFIFMGQLYREDNIHDNGAYLDLCGRAGVSVFYLCLQRALDILCDHPAADPERIAVTGLSGGGWQTVFISALDERVKLATPVAGHSGMASRIENKNDIGDFEQLPVDMLTIGDYVHLTALIAPRPLLLIYNEKDNCCFQAYRAVPSIYEPLVPLYKLFGDKTELALHINKDPGTHNYLKDNREAFYRFINRHFVPADQRIDQEINVENEIRPRKELEIIYPENNATLLSLAVELMRDLPAVRPPGGDAAAIEAWREKTRTRLGQVVRPEAKMKVQELPDSPVVKVETIGGVEGRARLFKVGGHWTIPTVEYVPVGHSEGHTLILADKGRETASELVAQALKRNHRAFVVDILFTGECDPGRYGNMTWGNVIAMTDRRSLGVQVAQLDTLIDWLESRDSGRPLQIVTNGRVTGLAALVHAALHPGRVERLELHRMERSLKDLPAKKVKPVEEPSLFCFGLLQIVDITELIALGKPMDVTLE